MRRPIDVSSSEVSAENDKCSFESIADGRKLTDKDIDAFQQLVRTVYPNVKVQQCADILKRSDAADFT